MPRSPIAALQLDTLSAQVPAAPSLSAVQDPADDHAFHYTLTPPTLDKNGAPIAALTGADLAAAVLTPAQAQQSAQAGDRTAITALPGVQLFHHDAPTPGQPVSGDGVISSPGESIALFATVTA